jgi:hypothetical protein
MPSITLTEIARMRLQGISFFLVALLTSSGLIQLLWNYLRKDFSAMPRLTYGKALGVVGLWGLLFVLVLTMISGARELMTPGAWEKQGLTYRLADGAAAEYAEGPGVDVRKDKLERLRVALWEYAGSHDGQLPPDQAAVEVPAHLWLVPEPHRLRYLYVPGHVAGRGAGPVAYEPDLYRGERFVLLANGDIRLMTSAEISRVLAEAPPR